MRPTVAVWLAIHQIQGYFSAGLLGFPFFWGDTSRWVPSIDSARERVLNLVEPFTHASGEEYALPLALWNGADHAQPEPYLVQTLGELQRHVPEYRFVHAGLEEFVHYVRALAAELPTITGELRGSRYHPLLSSVLSARVHLKQRNAYVQRLLERIAEPLAAIATTVPSIAACERDAHPFRTGLEEAWRLLLANHGHESTCNRIQPKTGALSMRTHRARGVRVAEPDDIGAGVFGGVVVVGPSTGAYRRTRRARLSLAA